MKHPDYDWMLFGCHPISDIAMAYCPCDHHPDPSAYSCRDSRIGNAVRSVLRKAETRFQRKPLIYFNISILSFISYVSGKCPAGCPPKIISLWRTARMNERRSVRKDVHTENDLK